MIRPWENICIHGAADPWTFIAARPRVTNPVTDGGVRDELLEVGLRHGGQGAVDDADDRQDADPRGRQGPLLGHEGHIDADHAIAPELQEDPRKDHGAGRRRLDVGVRKPRVEGEAGDLDGEGHEEPHEDGHGEPWGQGGSRLALDHLDDVEGAVGGGDAAREVEDDDSQEHGTLPTSVYRGRT